MSNVLDCDILVCEFELQSRYYVHFRTNTRGKSIYLFITPSYELNSDNTSLLQW